MLLLLPLLLFNLLPHNCNAQVTTDFHHIFENDTCDLRCGNRPFTLCDIFNETHPNCTNIFKLVKFYTDKEMEDLNIKHYLIIGHNGLRDRIATRMHVANMLYVRWDNKLQRMSRHWANICQPYEDDRCARIGSPLTIDQIFDHYTMKLNYARYVTMNRMCIMAGYLPNEFIEIALNLWYFGKNSMQPPQYKRGYWFEEGILRGNNNFTHIAFPLTYRFGCTVARYDKHFCLFCYYYPYYPSPNQTMVFIHEKPVTSCPREFPMANTEFPAVCSTNVLLNADGEYDEASAVIIMPCLPLLTCCIISLNLL